jgi:hypothetical protein
MHSKFYRRLDFDEPKAQKIWKVFSSSENFYATSRRQVAAANVLRDESGSPSECLLQAIWQHQLLRRDQLKTSGGKMIRIFHPGFISVEGGPDFQGAIIQMGGESPRSGDVEIDLRSAGWRAHGHEKNKNFQNVILHVVWDDPNPFQMKMLPLVCP